MSDSVTVLTSRLAAIRPVDTSYETVARAHIDDLTKPRGSLGMLEDLATQLFAVYQGVAPLSIDPIRHYTLAGDHGVVVEGVTSNPPEVTRQMVLNFLNGGAGINALCRSAGVEFFAVDAGCRGDRFPAHALFLDRRIAPGTANMAHGPAMSREQCAQALLMGMDLAAAAAREGIRCLSVGEMGIANTTSASALFAAFFDVPVSDITGPGAGLGSGGLAHKIAVIEQALANNHNALDSGNPLDILAAFGGYEVAGMAGVMLGAASEGIPCLVDGFIAQAACIAAWKLCPAVDGYTIFTHVSAEPGSAHLLRVAGRKPLLDLGLRLGEGTGCALAVPLIRAACAMYNDMATFSGAGVTKA